MVENAPQHEQPSISNIRFGFPSDETHHVLDVALRWGSDFNVRLSHQALPAQYPFSNVDVVFDSGRYERSPYSSDDVSPKWVSYYTIDTKTQLRDSKTFTLEEVEKIANALRSNTGMGDLRTLDNGRSQITIPGQSAMEPYDRYRVFNTQNPNGKSATVLDLGITDLDRAIAYFERRRDQATFASDYKTYEKKVADLRAGKDTQLSSLNIGLRSQYLYRDGDNVEFRGRLNREFLIDRRSPDYHPFDVPDKHLGVYSVHITPYFINSGYMLQAVCDAMGIRDLPSVIVPVEIPSTEDKSAWDAEQEIPNAFKEFLGDLGFS